jgi:hypothetical protein
MLVHDGKILKECGFKKRILQIQATQAELKLKDKRSLSLRLNRERRQEAKEEAQEKADEVKKVNQNTKEMKQWNIYYENMKINHDSVPTEPAVSPVSLYNSHIRFVKQEALPANEIKFWSINY